MGRVGLVVCSGRGATTGDPLVVVDDLGDHEVEELLRERRVQPGLVGEVAQVARLRALADEAGLDPQFAEAFLNFIVAEVIHHHERIAGSTT